MARHSLRSIRRHGELVVSPSVLTQVYSLARERFPGVSADIVRGYVGDLTPACRSTGTSELMDRAFRIEDRLLLPWEQCLTFAAASAADCRLLVSEDIEDGLAVERTTVINPFTTDIETVFSTLKDR